MVTTRVLQCATCGTWFNDTDNTSVCPFGHEPDDEYPIGEVTC